MRYLIIVISFVLLAFVKPQEQPKIYGKYKVVHSNNYKEKDGVITFKGDNYKIKFNNGKTAKGAVTVKKGLILLKENDTDLATQFFKNEIDKDTINCLTVDLTKDYKGDILIFTDRLIKVK